MPELKIIKVVAIDAVPYEFDDDTGNKVEGNTYYLTLNTPIGDFVFKQKIKPHSNDELLIKMLMKELEE
jgi:hypothetical protein